MRRIALFIGLLLAAYTAEALDVTFAWDPGIDWPAGTTVEVCGNGDVCQTGLPMRGKVTLNLDVNPGQQIVGQARAKSDDIYSEWIYIRKIIPISPIDLQGSGVRQ